MNLTFTKFYLPEYFTDEQVKLTKLKLNYVYEDCKLIGQYFCQGNKHWFKIFEKETIIETKRRLFQSTEYLLVNKGDSNQIGHFEIQNHFNQSKPNFSAVSYSDNYSKIHIGKDVYKFRLEPPEINFSLSEKKTQGYSFAFYDGEMNQKIRYDVTILNPLLEKSVWTCHNLDGTVECSDNNYQLLFAGFFLLEKFFAANQHFG